MFAKNYRDNLIKWITGPFLEIQLFIWDKFLKILHSQWEWMGLGWVPQAG